MRAGAWAGPGTKTPGGSRRPRHEEPGSKEKDEEEEEEKEEEKNNDDEGYAIDMEEEAGRREGEWDEEE